MVSLADLAVELFVCGTAVWELATEHGEQEDTYGPDVSWWPTVLCLAHNLRCHVRGCTAEDLDLFLVWNAGGEAKVNDLDV